MVSELTGITVHFSGRRRQEGSCNPNSGPAVGVPCVGTAHVTGQGRGNGAVHGSTRKRGGPVIGMHFE